MPKRVVDGEAVWRSKKLKLVSPQFRAEYANLVPLAEANGVFEVDADRVWSDVYSYNREDVLVETVKAILSELETVGLLRVWEEGGKTWGYWEGIHKSGRLPKTSELLKYKNLPPNPPENSSLSGVSAESQRRLSPRFGIGLVLDRSGTGAEPQEQNEELLGETDMKSEKQITVACQQVFGRSVRLYDTHKSELKRLDAAYKGSAVLRAFEEWAASNHEEDYANPVAVFLTLADDILSDESTPQKAAKSPEVVNLVRELAYLSDGKVSFGDRSKPILAEALAAYSQTEILSVFRVWLSEQDFSISRNLDYADKNFSERVDQLCFAARKKKMEKEEEHCARESAKLKLQGEAEAERAHAETAKNSESELFDPLAVV